MKKVFAAAVIMMSGLAAVQAQTVRGRVTGKDNEPVEYATLVLQTPDSMYVNSTYTDSAGRFVLSSGIMPAYRLIVQHVLYETYETDGSGEYEVDITLTEKENILGEVAVMGERPLVRLIDGRITYDVPLLLSGRSVSSAYESLLQLPGVREQNGSLVLAGASSVTVIINGQATSMPHENLMAALKMYPADRIQSAEIMYGAPPQYHIRGAAINLVLKGEASGNGLHGQVHTAYTQKQYANHATAVSVLLPVSKLTADVHYAYNRNQSKSGVDVYSNHLYRGTVHRIEQFNRGNRKSGDHHIRAGLDYRLTENSRINLAYTSQITAGMDHNESSEGAFSRSFNHKENRSPIQMHNVQADYTSGFGLNTGVEYLAYRNYTGQRFMEQMPGKENEFVADARQTISRYRFFADQSHGFPSGWTLRYGAQYLFAADRSSQQYVGLPGLDINSRLNEHTANVYGGMEKNFGQKLSLSASVTGEYYEIGDWSEWTLFPALEMTCFVSPSQIMQLSFSSDKVYPAYWEMHGAASFLNGYSEIHGNPLLKPYRDYSAQFNYVLHSKYIFTLYYHHQDKYFAQLPYQAHDRLSLIYQTLNFDYKQTAGLNLIIPIILYAAWFCALKNCRDTCLT
ncbi:MAG: TonB-dependent receptor family protein [Tannerellaceae bacterium]|jgi:hypothetical protein|nr:TonB-dependent receptor family protein [Tannerellaceae bacterium]